MPHAFRHAICNEVFQGWKFDDACRAIREAGYTGIEIAPFTLSEFPATISAADRNLYRRIMQDQGLHFAGLHWLMVAPKGLHVTTPDSALREKSWRHIEDLIDLCGDLADGQPERPIMVFGSPKQRATTTAGSGSGISRAEATRHWQEGFARVARKCAARGTTILVEALPSGECDVVNTLAEAAEIVYAVASPAVRTMFDTHNAADETEPHAIVVDRYFPLIRHVHVNEMDGRYPGTGNYDFASLFRALARRHYTGWISLEVFDFSPGAEKIANDSLRYLEAIIGTLES